MFLSLPFSCGCKTHFKPFGVNRDLPLPKRTLYDLSYHKVQRISGGVTGTPTYFLNDVPIAAEQTWTLTDWKQVIDPLLVGVRSLKAVSISLLVPRLQNFVHAQLS